MTATEDNFPDAKSFTRSAADDSVMASSWSVRMPLSLGTDMTESVEGVVFSRHSGGIASDTWAFLLAARSCQVMLA